MAQPKFKGFLFMIVLMAFWSLGATTACGQATQSDFRLGAYLGLQGTAFHRLQTGPPLRPALGFVGGGVVSYLFGKKWSAQTGVEAAMNAYALVEDSAILDPRQYPNGVQEPGVLRVKFHDYSVHTPLLLRFHPRSNDLGFYWGLGPDLRFSLKYTQHLTVVTFTEQKVLDSRFQLSQLHVGFGLQTVVGSHIALGPSTILFWELFCRLNQLNTIGRAGVAQFDFGIRLGYQF